MSTTVSLGGITLDAFEIPSVITFGGSQRMAVHDMPGGGRVIDVLGSVAADITFEGIISGSDAETRAALIDTLRVSGAVLVLSYSTRYETVIIKDARFDYTKPWWIPYQLRCVVQGNFSFGLSNQFDSAAAAISADLANAGVALDGLPVSLTAVTATLGIAGATTFGTASYAQSLAALTGSQVGVSTLLASLGNGFGSGLDSGDLSAVTTSAGSLAALASASGSLGHALCTLQAIGT